jgi:hypothetical protein
MLSTSTLLKTSLVLLGILSTALAAEARNRHSSHAVSVGGEVEVVKEIPGGVVRVGVVIGKGGHRVEHREPEVIVVKERQRPRHQEVIVVQEPACERDWRDAEFRRSREREFRHMGGKGRQGGHGGNIRVYESGNQFSYHRQGHGYNERYFRDGHQVSYTVEGPEGRYHYFENGEMISIDDNRQGANQHVFIRK